MLKMGEDKAPSFMTSIEGGAGKLEQLKTIVTFPSHFCFIVWKESDLSRIKKAVFLLLAVPTIPLTTGSIYIQLSRQEGKWLSKEEFHNVFTEDTINSEPEGQMKVWDYAAPLFLVISSVYIYLGIFRMITFLVK